MIHRKNRGYSVLLAALLLAGALSGCVQTAADVPEETLPASNETAAWVDAPSGGQEPERPVEQTAPVSDGQPPEDTGAAGEPEQQTPEEPPTRGDGQDAKSPAQEGDSPAQDSEPPAQDSEPPAEPSVQVSEPPEQVQVQDPPDSPPEDAVADTVAVDAPAQQLEDEAVALSDSPAALPLTATAVASGVMTKESSDAVIDYSNVKDGYVMVRYTAQTDSRLKVQVKGPTTTYTYNLTVQVWAALPLSDGNGTYKITVYKNVTGSKYAAVLSLTVPVTLADEFAPFLHSNQYVNFDAAPNAVAKAAQLTKAAEDPLKKVEVVYDYVVGELTYDKELAAGVKSGYLPELDQVLAKKSGICFDYAALMTGMLRSQGVPCKLVVGYAGTVYHAWISVWSEDDGWVDGVIWFDGAGWQRMDPTFASSGNSSESILAYIGDGTNYSAKYFY